MTLQGATRYIGARRRDRRGGPLRAAAGAWRRRDASYKPEKGAKLRVLRWTPFVQGDEDAWLANTEEVHGATGVHVRVDNESWEDIRPKAAVAANVGPGPDIVLGWYDDAFQYPDKLLDLTEIANYFGRKYGGWYQGRRGYGKKDRPVDRACRSAPPAAPSSIAKAWMKAGGLRQIPEGAPTTFSKLCQALKAKGKPGGFALGNAVGDANNCATGSCGATAARWSTRTTRS